LRLCLRGIATFLLPVASATGETGFASGDKRQLSDGSAAGTTFPISLMHIDITIMYGE
jgi:hypothetical protein